MLGCGRKLKHTAGRLGSPKILQAPAASNCTHGTPAGLPFGMPGIGLLMDGAMQHAAQPRRQENSGVDMKTQLKRASSVPCTAVCVHC